MITSSSPEKDTTLRSRPARQVTLDAEERDPPRRATGESRRTGSGSEIQPGLLRRMTTGLFEPERPVGKAPGYWQSLVAAAKSSWL
jgi:Ca2+:H+ antiporter